MLSPEQITARRGKLTGSRVAVLMNGDARGVMNLWLELTGDPDFVPEDLSQVWPVRLGECTEALQLAWYEMKNGAPLSRVGEVVVHPDYTWAAATLDAFDDILRCPLECKHVGGREPLEVIIERYAPQTQWQMFVTGASQCALSVIMGASQPIVEYLERDDKYVEEMVMRGAKFMKFVERKIPPVALPPVPAPIIADKSYDMSEYPNWQAAAEQWIQTYGAAQSAKDAEKTLKNLVPEDAKKAFGSGVRITRDRVGRLSLREETL
jgi:predicted phage-related endonuclease